MQMVLFYEKIGGDYEDVKLRLQSDALIERFVLKFLADTSFERLEKAVKESDFDEAFKAAHTLKGVCQNLSFEKLSVSSCEITECLRHHAETGVNKEECDRLFNEVKEDYETVVNAINEFKD